MNKTKSRKSQICFLGALLILTTMLLGLGGWGVNSQRDVNVKDREPAKNSPSPTPAASWTNVYTADFGIEAWTLSASSGFATVVEYEAVTGDAYASYLNPTTNYGTSPEIQTTYFDAHFNVGMKRGYFTTCVQDAYLGAETVQALIVYATSVLTTADYGECETFDENTLTWNNQPNYNLYSRVRTGISVGWNTFYTDNSSVFVDTIDFSNCYSSKEGANPPKFLWTVPKFYNATGRMWCQTNTTETLTLASPTLSTLNLRPTDEIRVTFSTTSTHQINLLTSYDGTTVASRELVPNENSIFITQTKSFTLAAAETIDGLCFTGLFDDTQNLQITSIEILGDRVLPELELVHPSVGADQTLLQLSERIFGTATAPSIEWGIGNIPVIKATARDGESSLDTVTASIAGNQFALGHPTWDGALPIDYELSTYGGQWEEWKSFWNAMDAGGQYLRGQGVYNLTITARDLAELERKASILIYRDLTPPDIVVSGIANGTGHAACPSVALNIMDEVVGDLPGIYTWGVYGAGYTFHLVDGSNPLDADWEACSASPMPLPGSSFVLPLNATAWVELPEGPVTVTFMVLDFGGNLALKSFNIIKDMTVPIVQVTAPETNGRCTATVPSFAITVTENNLASVQYAFGGSSTDWYDVSWTPGSSVSTIQQLFDATAWASLIASTPEADNFPIKFKVTDLAGQSAITSVSVNIDARAPRLKLLNPEDGTRVGAEAPAFLFEFITDPNLAEVFYTLSGSDTKYYVTVGTLSGQIDQSAWDLALNRTVTVTFFAKDSFGNVATFETMITRTDYVGPGDDPNPGFHNFFEASPEVWAILGGVGAVTLVVLTAYYRAMKKRLPKIPPEDLIRALMEENGGSPA